MRPHKLKMSAFGPFAQETVVDFDKMGNNIFLISGDTGIGKTTIFDGMIYALYGKASGGGRSSLGTEALHSDYCKDGKHKDKMEVSFTFSNAGRMYTVVREMSWGKNGNNQTAVKESTLLENNSVMIHAKGREDRDEVTLKIQEILGLDADQFRRIIMLEQGEFQKFLTSGSDDRGKILGKLFDNRRHIDLQLRLKAAYKMVDSKIKDNSSNIRAQIEAFIFPQDHAAETDQMTADNPDLLPIMDSVIKSLSQESENISDAIVTTNAGLLELNKEMTRAENNNKRLAELDREKSAFDRLQLQNGVIDAMKKKVEPAKAAKELEGLTGDEKTGAQIVLKALEAPLFYIAENAGLSGAVVVNKVKESADGIGFDAYNDKYVDMIEAGIIDPAKVTRSALQNAASVSSELLTTEAVVGDIKEPAPAAPAQPAGGMY